MASVVLPKVRLFFPCVSIEQTDDDLCTIIQPIYSLHMPAGVKDHFLLDEIWIYAQLTDGVGNFNMSVELYHEDGILVGKSNPVYREFAGGSQLDVYELVVPMTDMPFARPGVYEFRLIANHAALGDRATALVRVFPG